MFSSLYCIKVIYYIKQQVLVMQEDCNYIFKKQVWMK